MSTGGHHADTGAPETISALLHRLASAPGGGRPPEHVSLGELVASLETRAFGIVLMLLAIPNLTPGPTIPFFSTFFGLPLIFVAGQMMLGYQAPWIPERLARVLIPRRRLSETIAAALPRLRRVEHILKPRLRRLAGPAMSRAVGALGIVLGLLLTLPIPLYSMLPAFAVLLVAFGLLAHDGLAVVLGAAMAAIAVAALVGLIWLARAAIGLA